MEGAALAAEVRFGSGVGGRIEIELGAFNKPSADRILVEVGAAYVAVFFIAEPMVSEAALPDRKLRG